MPDTPAATAVAALVMDTPVTVATRLLTRHENVVLYGPPGTGKSRAAKLVADGWRIEYGDDSVINTTFHPSYSYEDFVEGFRPDPEDPSKFRLTDGVLFKAADRAKAGPTLLVIDEINRADVAKVFGELITYIEADKRDTDFTTAQRPDEPRDIPSELYVIGTMNTADKSISLLDVALRRRFKFVECPPDPTAFVTATEWKASAFGIDLGDLLTAINDALLRADIGRDRLVGQALLSIDSAADDSDLFDRLRYDVYPLVEEYLFGDAARMADVLPGLVDQHGGLDPQGLTVEILRSWLPGRVESPGIEADSHDDVASDA
ncbi:AAA family ATPase [Kribbella sp. NPDC003505]|uniref:McrB family protein n=1 Tax=Kribbella sp. NPDC003505 TaxID=3154448 RepID=UPI0033A95D7B